MVYFMMSDTWKSIQVVKSRRNILREKLQKRKKERQDILNVTVSSVKTGENYLWAELSSEDSAEKNIEEMEYLLLEYLSDIKLVFPITSWQLLSTISKKFSLLHQISHSAIFNLLHKFSLQRLISISKIISEGESGIEVISAEQGKLLDMVQEIKNNDKGEWIVNGENQPDNYLSEKSDNPLREYINNDNDSKIIDYSAAKKFKEDVDNNVDDILSLISTPSIREKELKKIGEEILDLLSKPTAKERSLTEKFRSQGGTQLTEFCIYRTRADCMKEGNTNCKKLHFKKIIEPHTDENLGDCSYLNTCFHMSTCKYVHYEVDKISTTSTITNESTQNLLETSVLERERTILYPAQWIQCDLRYFDTSILGKFAVVMADPPWDIHMELPYGTLSDDEMRCLGVPNLQDNGLLFLWVTGRAMELGRDCLSLWGYEYVDELIWVKTNQLQRIIRTGRTGHWLNHGKEHCLIGMKGNPQNLNRGLDCDVIVAEVRDTSHKPDEIYGIIERLSPGTRKIELFGRSHNVQPNWITLGNQLEGVRLVDPEIIASFSKRYPDGNCMNQSRTR